MTAILSILVSIGVGVCSAIVGYTVGSLTNKLWNKLSIGTKSVLLGAHAFWLHFWFVAEAWRRLYGFPWDPRLWVAFLVHDWGYVGKTAMDSEDGELHPHLGANIVHALCDWPKTSYKWHDFCLFHSRHLAKRYGQPFSRLCVADKLAGVLTPSWLYLPMVKLTGEIKEYRSNAQKRAYSELPEQVGPEVAAMANGDDTGWHKAFQSYMRKWVDEHKDGKDDTWTPNRYGKAA